ncbi:ATP-grasp domain-containing protein [Pseudomonas sp. BP8]|uniref:ATP-grasp domain-containing protein n=1 Tax=Pseudomonas sp. BP8 TaxID=2817864 RepID=UPI001AE7B987|nr:ATP-grasp domain-containing protein [Pseudomonas sp. BP8]MBP2264031.1 L-amino acid ligase [Pseudomonas sp. BP8]HDS1734059.1 ATP-grasp domain-containing protein [Pseudomonas putida]
MRIPSSERIACIVDGYSTGTDLSIALKELGWTVVHVQSAKRPPLAFAKSFNRSLFDAHLLLAEMGYKRLVAQLLELNPELVIAGSEPGVELADALNTALGLQGNSPLTSIRRRNKFHMSQSLSECGLDAVDQHLVTNREQLIKAIECLGLYPIVVKPVDAMGSENVRVCHEIEEAVAAFEAILGKTNFIGSINSAALVQEYLQGDQYVVNAVSVDGQHRITEIWHERRLNIRGVGNLYDYETLLPYEGDTQRRLIEYTCQVLNALELREGPSHSEIMLTPRGPVLIETGARMQGGIVSAPIIEAIGDSHMTMTLKRYLNPQAFLQSINDAYTLSINVRVVNLIMDRAGTVKENNCHKLLATLPSFRMIARTPDIGSRVPKTIDLATKVGHIYLMHENLEQLDWDYRRVRDWEKKRKLIALE